MNRTKSYRYRSVCALSVAAIIAVTAGQALADCKSAIDELDGSVNASQVVTEIERAQASFLLDRALARHNAGDEAACMVLASEVATMVGAPLEARGSGGEHQVGAQ